MASKASSDSRSPKEHGDKTSKDGEMKKQTPIRVPFDTKAHWIAEDKLTRDDRRDRYQGSAIVTLDDIQTWADHAETLVEQVDKTELIGKLQKKFSKHDAATVKMVAKLADLSDHSMEKARLKSYDWDDEDLACSFDGETFSYEPNERLNRKVSLYIGDITTLELDSIVNAANMAMRGGGGIDGRIHQVAGPSLLEECIELNGCATGRTKPTRGHRLPCRFILHTVGPRVQDDAHPIPQAKLMGCYNTCLDLVSSLGLRSIAFCCISTGIFNYPLETATHTALKMVRQWLEEGNNADSIDRIVFCVYGKPEWDMYEKMLQIYFPPVEAADSLSVLMPTTKRSSPINSSFNGVEINDAQALIAAIKAARQGDGQQGEIDLRGLESLLSELPKAESKHFFKTILPKILVLASGRKETLANWEPLLLEQGGSHTSGLKPNQIACLLACAFLTILPQQSLHAQKFAHLSFEGLWKSWESGSNGSAPVAATSSSAPSAEAEVDETAPKKKKKSSKQDAASDSAVAACKANAEARFKAILAYFDSAQSDSTSSSPASNGSTSREVSFTRQTVPAAKDQVDWRRATNKLVPVHVVPTAPLTAAPSPQVTLLPVHSLVARDFFVHTDKLSKSDRFFWSCPETLVLALLASELLPVEVLHITNAAVNHSLKLSDEGVLTFEGAANPTSSIFHAILVPQQPVTPIRHEQKKFYIYTHMARIMGAIRTLNGGLKIAVDNWCADAVFQGNGSLLLLAMLLSVTSFETLNIGETFKDKKKLPERLTNCPELFLYESEPLGTQILALMAIIEKEKVQYEILLATMQGTIILEKPLPSEGHFLEKLAVRFAHWKKEYKEFQKAQEKERRAREKQAAKEAEERRQALIKKKKELEKANRAAIKESAAQAKTAGKSGSNGNGSAKSSGSKDPSKTRTQAKDSSEDDEDSSSESPKPVQKPVGKQPVKQESSSEEEESEEEESGEEKTESE